ncbi:MAG: efflux RND transporter periplasmic adaptor subunit [Bacteroidales bacterium]|nr:efflux RND transporter periplasmic adaptor subunit [Bacteroidales bacterium]
MRHIHTVETISVLAITALMLGGCHKSDKKTETEPQEVDVAEVAVDTVTIHTEYPGYLIANNEVELVARVDGYLTGKLYDSGDFVRKGTVLFTIESGNYAEAVKRARAELADAEASYAYASNNYAAMQRALKSDAVSQMEVLQSKSNMETAQAAISSARAALQQAQTTLGYCTVRAPFDGHVSSANYDVGAYLAGGGSPVSLGKIYDDSEVVAVFSIDDRQFATVKANAANPMLKEDLTKIPIDFDGVLPHKYTANLTYMSPAIDRSTGTMTLQAHIANPYNDLRPGMFCKIKMPLTVVPDAILVKDASIGNDQSGSYVYVVDKSGKVTSRAIKTGEVVADTMRVVTSGLKPGDRYVTKALLKVRDGMTVRPHLVK